MTTLYSHGQVYMNFEQIKHQIIYKVSVEGYEIYSLSMFVLNNTHTWFEMKIFTVAFVVALFCAAVNKLNF